MAQAAFGEARNSTERSARAAVPWDSLDAPRPRRSRTATTGRCRRSCAACSSGPSRARRGRARLAGRDLRARPRDPPAVRRPGRATRRRRTQELLDQLRAEVSEHAQRQTTRALLEHMDMMSRLGPAHRAAAGNRRAGEHVADPRRAPARARRSVSWSPARYVGRRGGSLGAGRGAPARRGSSIEPGGLRFPTRAFPPAALRDGDGATQLLVLPLRVDEGPTGFVALATSSLEPAAAIVSNLATALRAAQLYREALEGRRLAEEATSLKSRFLSTVSHELRTPLSVVVGLSDIVAARGTRGRERGSGPGPRPRADGCERGAPRPADRRRPGPGQRRVRPAAADARAGRPWRGAARRRGRRAARWRGAGPGVRGAHSGRAAVAGGRSDAARPGRAQPDRQRGQVHRARAAFGWTSATTAGRWWSR